MKRWLNSQPLTRSRYRVGRQLRSLAKQVEPTVTPNWEIEAEHFSNLTMTNVTTTWPIYVDNPSSGGHL